MESMLIKAQLRKDIKGFEELSLRLRSKKLHLMSETIATTEPLVERNLNHMISRIDSMIWAADEIIASMRFLRQHPFNQDR